MFIDAHFRPYLTYVHMRIDRRGTLILSHSTYLLAQSPVTAYFKFAVVDSSYGVVSNATAATQTDKRRRKDLSGASCHEAPRREPWCVGGDSHMCSPVFTRNLQDRFLSHIDRLLIVFTSDVRGYFLVSCPSIICALTYAIPCLPTFLLNSHERLRYV